MYFQSKLIDIEIKFNSQCQVSVQKTMQKNISRIFFGFLTEDTIMAIN
jgi:hypothetical protein